MIEGKESLLVGPMLSELKYRHPQTAPPAEAGALKS